MATASTMKLLSEDNQEFRKILELATVQKLLIFVGAGCSIEAGLPDWRRLVSRYINLALLIQSEIEVNNEQPNLSRDIIPQSKLEAFADPPHLAIIADAIVGEHRRNEILSLALYPEREKPKPGPTAEEIAKFYRARLTAGLETSIVTTNYDPLLEIALDTYLVDQLPSVSGARGFGLDDLIIMLADKFDNASIPLDEYAVAAKKYFESPGDTHEPKVLHLHGAIDFRDGPGVAPILLTEKDYAKFQHVAQAVLSGLLMGPDCLMVGLGLEDNDVLTALYSVMDSGNSMKVPPAPQGSRYILALNDMAINAGETPSDRIVEQVRALVTGDDGDDQGDPAVEQIRRLEAQRLQLLDVTALKHLKNFAQIPQVIHEMGVAVDLAHRRKNGMDDPSVYWKSTKHYSRRLAQWKEDFADTYLPKARTSGELGKFAKQQKKVSDTINDALEGILEDLVESTVVSDELAIHIWVRSRADDPLEMFLWGGNEYARQRGLPSGLSRKVQHSKFDIGLRQAFEGVSSRGFRRAAPHSRWSQIMAVPVISSTFVDKRHKYGRLLLGVVTLSTNLPPDKSDISECLEERSELLAKIEDRLSKLGGALLITDLKA